MSKGKMTYEKMESRLTHLIIQMDDLCAGMRGFLLELPEGCHLRKELKEQIERLADAETKVMTVNKALHDARSKDAAVEVCTAIMNYNQSK